MLSGLARKQPMRILALDDYGGAFAKSKAFERLCAAGHEVSANSQLLRGYEMVSAAASYEALLLTQQRTPIPSAMVAQLPNLRWILNTGRNTDHLDVEACTKRGIEVVVAGGGCPAPAAEHTWAIILAAVRRIVENYKSLHAGQWQSSAGTGLSGKTLGVLGLGEIGKIVASVGSAFGMRILCHGRPGGTTATEAVTRGYAVADSMQEIFQQADVLCVHQRYSKDTHASITGAHLALMKPSALFVNTSRAGLVEPGALVAALCEGRPGWAAVDVFEDEPVPADHPLLQLPNALCTPHLGYVTEENMESYYSKLVEALFQHEAYSAPAPSAAIASAGPGEGGYTSQY